MDKDAQRIAIAEACGWSWFYAKHNHWIVDGPNGEHFEPGYGEWEPFDSHTGDRNARFPKWHGCDFIPDYLNDLNACAEMENSLDASQWDIYRRNLAKEWATNEDDGMWAAINSTAPQRAEAFLRTLNLWSTGSEAGE